MRIFFDSDTQYEFGFPKFEDREYMESIMKITPNLRKLTDYARMNFIPVLGSIIRFSGEKKNEAYEQPLKDELSVGKDDRRFTYPSKFSDTIISETYGDRDMPDNTFYIGNLLPQKKTIENIFANNFDMYGLSANYALLDKASPFNKNTDPTNRMDRWDNAEKFFKSHIKKGEKKAVRLIREFIKDSAKGILRARSNDALEIILDIDKFRKTIGFDANLDTRFIKNEYYENLKGIYFEKQKWDPFSNRNLEEVLKIAEVDEAIVYGLITEKSIMPAVLGMQKRGIQTYVVTDAIAGWQKDVTKELTDMERAGAIFVKTNDVIKGKIK